MNRREAAIQCANDQYCARSGDNIELDDNPQTCEAGDGTGMWVQAWVFIRNEDIEAEQKGWRGPYLTGSGQ